MNTAGRQEKQIARSDGIVAQGIGQRMVCDLPFILRRSELFRETRFQMRPPIRRHDIPHLRLAVLAMPHPSQYVVGVHLNRKILTGVDEFHQQRKFRTMPFVDGMADQLPFELPDKFRQGHAGIFPLSDDRFIAFHTRQFPALADIGPVDGNTLIGCDPVPAPDHAFEERGKFKSPHCLLSLLSN